MLKLPEAKYEFRFMTDGVLDLQQEANLQRVKKGDMKASIHRMEIDRIRFVLSSYLRSRLQKVSGFRDLALETNLSFSDGCHISTPVCPD